MTTPGPTLIKKCNSCKGLMKQRTIASGNTLGAKYWTDGKVDAPMLPITPEVVACPHCRKVQWINDLEEVGEIPGPRGFGVTRPEYDKTFDHQPFIELPLADDYLEFLKSGERRNDQEIYLRSMYWHLMNDKRRQESVSIPLINDEVENLKRLLILLEPVTESMRITIAEIHRELGDFDSCAKSLDYDFSSEFIPAAIAIYIEQEIKNPYVTGIFTDSIDEAAWHYHRDQLQLKPDAQFDPSGPPIFKIKSSEWWIKVLGMLQHNWALIEENDSGRATVYFFHDCGEVKMAFHGYTKKQLEGRCAVIDSLSFQSVQLAAIGLIQNGFRVHGKDEFVGSDVKPSGNFYDARDMEEGVYSKQGYWKSF